MLSMRAVNFIIGHRQLFCCYFNIFIAQKPRKRAFFSRRCGGFQSHHRGIEILSTEYDTAVRNAFNRTIMELKFVSLLASLILRFPHTKIYDSWAMQFFLTSNYLIYVS